MIAAFAVATTAVVQAARRDSQQASQDDEHENEVLHARLLKLKALVKNAVRLEGKGDFEKAVHLRNHIYQNVPKRISKEVFDSLEIDYMYAKAMGDTESGHYCAGMTILYVAALESQGIPARYVGIFSDDKCPSASHATAEFWHDGKWYASDPLNNIMFTYHGEYLSYAELFSLVQAGNSFEVVTNGYPVAKEKDREIRNYPECLRGFMKFMVIHPSEVRHEGRVDRYPMQLLPEGWDGGLTFENGERRDVCGIGGIYNYLQTGPLR